MSFKVNQNKGFHLIFDNGLTLSTQFGGGNYCDNYNMEIKRYESGLSCDNAEIAIWGKNGNWITKEIMDKLVDDCEDNVYGYVSMELWIEIVDICKNYKETKTND